MKRVLDLVFKSGMTLMFVGILVYLTSAFDPSIGNMFDNWKIKTGMLIFATGALSAIASMLGIIWTDE